VTPPSVSSDAREFYAGCYPRLVGLLALVSGNRADAEEVAQEAFVRLIPRWATVSAYDNPEAWVRTVAFRLLSNRRRRARNGLAALSRAEQPVVEGPPSGDAVDVSRALAALTPGQRQVVVLHYFVDLSVDEIAHDLGIAAGTVKSRLARARAALAPLLAEDVTDHA
jgi:RNA polymerase sigma-70 factor (ECF subfamily)